jgi:transcriptional regulator with XRE-family HTH domain
MSFTEQVRALLSRRGMSVTELSGLTGIARPNLSATLAARHDARSHTLDALAAGLDAQWVLVPKEHLAAVRQVLAGKGTGPDVQAPSAAEMFLKGRQ